MKKDSAIRRKCDKQGRPNRKTCYNRGQNYHDTHYVFLHQSDDDNSDPEDGIQLQSPREEYLEKELEPGDTLQTLAIQFNCPVAELKRINHIHRENEVFARRKIKVPAKYYSLLSEKLVGVHKSPQTNKESIIWSSFEDSSKADCSQRDDTYSSVRPINVNGLPQDILDRSVCDPLPKDEVIFSSLNFTPPENTCDNDDVNTSLLSEDFESPPQDNNNEVFQCNGSDWGLSWPQLLLCTLLLGFAGPIVYIFYLKESLDEKNGNHTILGNNAST